MPLEDIVTELSMKLVRIAGSPSQVVFAITMQDVISELARTLGERALTMNVTDLMDVRKEVRIAIDELDLREFIVPAIEVWEIKSAC